MSRFATALFTCVIAMVLASGTALMPEPAEAARMSKAEKVALKEATIACRAEAKGKKVKWLARRKYVNNCVAQALNRPSIEVKVDKVALKQAIIACKAEARGKKVKWLARRKYVNNCVAQALNRPSIEVIQLLKNHPDMKELPIGARGFLEF
jgi:hypothetical protein